MQSGIPHDLWSLFGLLGSPFFQETLGHGGPYPSHLFVGREEETRRMLRTIVGSPSSRQVLHGPPGIGKTTLAQHAKDALSRDGFVIRWRPVAIVSGQGATGLLVELLASVYESVLTAHPRSDRREPMEGTRGLVRSFRQRGLTGGVSVLGTGITAGADPSVVQPPDAGVLSEAWRLLAGIAAMVRNDLGAPGIVVHLNNLENLTGTDDIETAAQAVRDLRDLFLAHAVHWLVVGTSEATQGVLGAHPQVRSVFLPSHPPLDALSEEEFVQLLAARYAFLATEAREPIRPVEDDAAARVYRLFSGDLRGALRTLEQGCLALAGFTDDAPVRPLRYEEIVATLRPRYEAEMRADLAETQLERLREMATVRGDGVTRGELEDAWGVTRQRVGQVVRDLERRGHVRMIGKHGRSHLYALTGTGLIALGLEG